MLFATPIFNLCASVGVGAGGGFRCLPPLTSPFVFYPGILCRSFRLLKSDSIPSRLRPRQGAKAPPSLCTSVAFLQPLMTSFLLPDSIRRPSSISFGIVFRLLSLAAYLRYSFYFISSYSILFLPIPAYS